MADPFTLAIASLVCAFGAFVQGALGFGMNLIAAPLLLLVEPRLVPVPLVLAASSLSLAMGWKGRRDADFNGMPWGFLGRIPAGLGAAWVVAGISRDALELSVATVVLAAVALSMTSLQVRPGRASLVVAGIASGFMGTATSVGGPPMALLYQHETGPRIRATLSIYFLVGCITSLIGYRWAGLLGGEPLLAGLALVPGTLAGYALSGPAAARLDAGKMRPAVLALCALAALAAIAANLLG